MFRNKFENETKKEIVYLTGKFCLEQVFAFTFPGASNNNVNQVYWSSCNSDHIITNSPDKVSQLGIINLDQSHHYLTCCSRKTFSYKSHEHNEIFVQSMNM